jgi:DNA invertase Pin-like site-specific DNA recombinase
MNKIFAYMRKSKNTNAQKHDRQELTLKEYAKRNGFIIDEIVDESISGTVNTDKRERYITLKDKLRSGDALILTDIDRLGRTADNVIHELKDLKQKGVRVVALDVPHMNEWEKTKDESIYEMIIDIVITLKAHMAQQENEKRRERINQGLDVARQKGVTLGRPKVRLPQDFIRKYKKFKNGDYGEMTAAAFAKSLEIGRSTLYKYIDVYNQADISI